MLSTLWNLLTNPTKVASDISSMPLDYACQTRVEAATKQYKWWADNGVWIGAGAVIAALIVHNAMKDRG